MSINMDMDVAVYSINDVLDALAKVDMNEEERTAEDLASELTGLSIDRLFEIGARRLPFYFVHDINWALDEEDNADELGLPVSCFVRSVNDIDMISDALSDATGFCMFDYFFEISSREEAREHALDVLLKEGYGRDEAERLLESTSVLEKKVITDKDILDVIKKDGQ